MPAKRAKHFEEYATPAIRIQGQSLVWSPPTNLFETDQVYIVRVEIAGLREGDFNIQMEQDILTIRGTRTDLSGRGSYHQLEVRYGAFHIQMYFPGPINSALTVAEYEDGFLTVTIPKETS